MCQLSRNLRASISWNPVGLSRPVMRLLYLFFISIATIIRIFFTARHSVVGQGLLIIEASGSHSAKHTTLSVGIPWTSDRPNAKTSTWQHTTLTRDRYPCPRRDTKPQSQQARGRRPTPETTRSLGWALVLELSVHNNVDISIQYTSQNLRWSWTETMLVTSRMT
jgi:hypothetical protein